MVFDDEGFYSYVGVDYTAEQAVKMALRIVTGAAAHMGLVSRVMITDEDDFANFLWERGKGVIYPPPH